MKRTLLTLAAGVALGAAAVAAPALGSHHAAQRFMTARIGDNVVFPAIDAECGVYRTDPDHYESGPIIFCGRPSAKYKSRDWGASRYHVWISDRTGNYIAYKVARAP
jgi:hypothetical protein